MPKTNDWPDDPDGYREEFFAFVDGQSDEYVFVSRIDPKSATGPFNREDADRYQEIVSGMSIYGPDYWLRLPLAAPSAGFWRIGSKPAADDESSSTQATDP